MIQAYIQVKITTAYLAGFLNRICHRLPKRAPCLILHASKVIRVILIEPALGESYHILCGSTLSSEDRQQGLKDLLTRMNSDLFRRNLNWSLAWVERLFAA